MVIKKYKKVTLVIILVLFIFSVLNEKNLVIAGITIQKPFIQKNGKLNASNPQILTCKISNFPILSNNINNLPHKTAETSSTLQSKHKKKYLIITKDLKTGKDLTNLIDQILAEPKFTSENQKTYTRVLFTGNYILEQYSPWLNIKNNFTVNIKKEFSQLFKQISTNNFIWNPDNYSKLKNLIAYIPTIKNPNLDLFIDVFENISEEQIKLIAHRGLSEGGALFFQLTESCLHNCLHCNLKISKGTEN